MFDLAKPEPAPPATLRPSWTAELYLDALHPNGGRGTVSGVIMGNNCVRTHTWTRELNTAVAANLVEQEAYIALNPFYGRRGGERRLAALNAIWLDLDTYRVPELTGLGRCEISDRIFDAIIGAGLPAPSFLVDSGRGFYAIWLLTGGCRAALPRWRAVMRALVDWAKPLGADPACADPARVLRLPGSWHEKAGRQVTVVAGDGARHSFELLADRIWRAVGRPARKELDAARHERRGRTDSDEVVGRGPRGLPRPAFWQEIRHDLDNLLNHWGGTVPVGMRDLWLHIYCCALTWTEPDADILGLIVDRAAAVAPDLTTRDVTRMMGTTIRRGLAAMPGRPRARDPRYDYSSDRLCELLSVDRPLAASLGLRQLVPADLRADRIRQRRTERRRAAGAMPRAIYLAANPASRLKLWEAEGVSRATWYRRQAEARRRRRGACLGGLLSGSAAAADHGETGAAPLYKGEAQPATQGEPAVGMKPLQSPSTSRQCQPPQEKTTRSDEPRRASSEQPPAFASGDADQSLALMKMEAPMAARNALDFDILKAGAHQLSHAEFGALARLALALADGPLHRADLCRRAKVPPDMLDRLDGWLQISEDSSLVAGLVNQSGRSSRARGPRQGLLFDQSTAAPTPVSKVRPDSLRAMTIAAGVRVLGRAGISESVARPFLGKILKDASFGALAEAIDALEPKIAEVADPRSWIKAHISRRTSGANKSGRGPKIGSPPTEVVRPLATPEFLGISPGRAAAIRERNRQIAERKLVPPSGSPRQLK